MSNGLSNQAGIPETKRPTATHPMLPPGMTEGTGTPECEMLPKLLYFGDVPVESSYHGSALLYRLLEDYPRDRLMILECASIVGEFEVSPPPPLVPYLEGLAIHELERAYWSNIPGWTLATPYGAGVCVRREVAKEYLRAARDNPIRQSLGRAGAHLGAGDDSDLSWTSTRLNLGFGRFPELRLTHLISERRLTMDYVSSLFAGFAGSGIVLDHLWNRPVKRPHLILQVVHLVKSLLSVDKMKRMIAWRSFLAKQRSWRLLRTAGHVDNSAANSPRARAEA